MTVLFSHLVVPLLFFLKFDGFILTLCSSNITCDNSFFTLSCSFTIFSHLTVPSSNFAVLTSHVTILFSHLIIILHLDLSLRSLFYLLITTHHNSNFFKVIKKFRSKIENQKKRKASHEISPTTIITLVHTKISARIILVSSTNIWIYQLTSYVSPLVASITFRGIPPYNIS